MQDLSPCLGQESRDLLESAYGLRVHWLPEESRKDHGSHWHQKGMSECHFSLSSQGSPKAYSPYFCGINNVSDTRGNRDLHLSELAGWVWFPKLRGHLNVALVGL